jgi:hypothetical protein
VWVGRVGGGAVDQDSTDGQTGAWGSIRLEKRVDGAAEGGGGGEAEMF